MREADGPEQPIKDEDAAHPVACTWRLTLREIVKAFGQGDYGLAEGIASVAPVPVDTVDHIRRYLRNYGETLAELPEDTWATSVSQWMGTHWELLVDLWTVESGRSDLVLTARVFECESGFRFEVESVYVP